MGAEAGQAGKTTSGQVSRPLGVCRKCCRAGISCSRPWVAGNKQQGAHLEPSPTHTRGGSSSPGAFPKPWGSSGDVGLVQECSRSLLGAVEFALRCWKVQHHALGTQLGGGQQHPRNGVGGAPTLRAFPSGQTLGYSLGSCATEGEAHPASFLRAKRCSSPAQNLGTPEQPFVGRTGHTGVKSAG